MLHKKLGKNDIEEIIKSILAYLPKFNAEKCRKAYEFASEAHKHQSRKDGSPYVSHPVAVIKILSDFRADEDTILAALLHDVPEDTDIPIEEIEKKFGKNVAFLVDSTTKLSKVYYRYDMAERQVESLKKLLIHSAKDPRAILIKLADRLHNMRTLQYVKEEKRIRIAKETMEIYVPIANLFGLKEFKNELEDLCFFYLYPDDYHNVLEKIKKSNLKLKSLIDKTIEIIKDEFAKQKISAHVHSRTRSLYTLFKKIESSGGKMSEIEDMLALRVIVKNKQQCYKTLGIIHGLFKPKSEMFKDYVAVPKANGYQSLHTTVFGVSGVSTEFQIRTGKMHMEAEYGILSRYFSDRHNKIMQLSKDNRSKWVDQILDIQKGEQDNIDFIEDLKRDVFEDRIFVFTPKGDSIDLPKDATCIDFAYAIHTDVGNSAVSAVVNGKKCPITTVLKTGNTVEIETSEEKSEPDISWLNFAKTNVAKSRIRYQLGKDSREEKIRRGRRVLQQEFDRAGLSLVSEMNFKKVQKAMRRIFKRFFASKEDLFMSIGEGSISALSVIRIILNEDDQSRLYFFTNKGTSGEIRPARVGIQVMCESRIGMLRDLTDVISKFALNIVRVKAIKSLWLQKPVVKFYLDVESFDKLSQLLRHLEQVPGVKGITRIFVKRDIWFLLISLFTIFIWVFHPFMIKYILHPQSIFHVFLHDTTLYFGFFMLFILIYFLREITIKSFPQFRETASFHVLAMMIPFLALVTIFAEMYFFGAYAKNWPIIAILSVGVFTYLFSEYKSYKKDRS